ncbi:cobalamin (vitamin B12) biosynthesis CbiM protein [Alkaliphilus metalliredigens QYMF]|uniref:Cobalamin (Vitamin B12) biosynthesis CbiM protein n=1 Tax=Alkaliphilus metalliredigens (strain QYMF) TaxID=293826 RepID=A6TKN2_ALKMQ|nr:CbiM family transporter [Alkaliphilus metalliredigens]ABR46750.1 cobalamin (vitamin B12) biosynthesis CbiM protein [Alkaliphilus metalliredigens QYMF]
MLARASKVILKGIFELEVIQVHLSDGVLNLPMAVTTSIAAGGVMIYAIKGIKEEEIPKISLMTAAFFTFALISIPIGPSSVHPLLAGLLGIMLGRRSPIAIFIGLLLQAIIFQHGGLTTLGVNTLLVALPALASYKLYSKLTCNKKSPAIWAGFIGGFAVFTCVSLLILVLFMTDSRYSEGFFSVVNVLAVGYLPLIAMEAILTGFIISFIYRIRPHILETTS